MSRTDDMASAFTRERAAVLACCVALFWSATARTDQSLTSRMPQTHSSRAEPTSGERQHHHESICRLQQTIPLVQQLLDLTTGPERQSDPMTWLSHHEVDSHGNRDYNHAQALGTWLGSMRLACNSQNLDARTASNWLHEILDEISAHTSLIDTTTLADLPADVAAQHLTFNEALELIAFGQVSASSVTTVIGQGIRESERHTLR